MKTSTRIAIIAVVVAAVATAIVLKERGAQPDTAPGDSSTITATNGADSSAPTATAAARPLPKLLDLGADKCIPCKMMAPILEELETEYADKMEVEFIDVWKNSDASDHYGINSIPTQIFYAADGTELFRHTGFFGKDDVLSKWKELGVSLE